MKLTAKNIPGKNTWQKAGVVILAAYLVYMLAKGISRWVENYRYNQMLDDATRVPADPGSNNFAPIQYAAWADQLEIILQGFPFTDEDDIVAIIERLQDSTDWYKIHQAFGTRKISRWILGNFQGNLSQWMQRRLNEKEKEDVQNALDRIGVYLF